MPVLEDAAEALGSTYQGKKAGTLGRIGIYSFNNNKVITTYGGGALLTADEGIARRVRFMASQARESLPYYEHHERGYNYLMGALNAAYGLAQLPNLNELVVNRRAIFDAYRQRFEKDTFQQEPAGHYSNRWLPAISFDRPESKDQFLLECEGKMLETRPLWRPMHDQPLFKNALFYDAGVSQALFDTGLCLPVELL